MRHITIFDFRSILKRSTSGASRGDASQATGVTAAGAATTAVAGAARDDDPSASSGDPAVRWWWWGWWYGGAETNDFDGKGIELSEIFFFISHSHPQSKQDTFDGASDSASLQEVGQGFTLGQKARPVIVGLAPKGDSLDVKDFVDIKQLEGLFRAYVMLAIVKVCDNECIQDSMNTIYSPHFVVN